ncbi:uncharacterized protein NPIL_68811 [Nephila pilipes]|uniref:Mutator-like transposase domain-containing protein n=1 Tax=Nephila pilipes TaxID=299642 RepID=A0A8X6PMR9_NEPPI|nr:uncharacterized protein NPIL_68811 [Nephila pilipes]
MNLGPPPAKFERYNDILLRSLIKVSRESMRNAVEDTVKNNNSNRDITAAFDGSWQKRGLTSLNGVVSATCLETGKVLDFECLSKYCFKCKNRNNKDHTCEKNFEGFSGGMESDGIKRLYDISTINWKRMTCMLFKDNVSGAIEIKRPMLENYGCGNDRPGFHCNKVQQHVFLIQL